MNEQQRDPLLDLLAMVTQKAYPSGGAIKWADRLVAEYGERNTMRALGKAAQETEPHMVLSLAQDILANSKALGERIVDKEKAAEIQQGRDERNQRQRDYLKSLEEGSAAGMQSLSELMPDVKMGGNRG